MCLYPISIKVPGHRKRITVRCGKCTECLKANSREWALRCCLEASQHDENCFITLTYNEEHLPPGGLLCKRHHQLFMKNLRKLVYPKKIRFFLSGEYGSKHKRPHYHICIFGWRPKDLVFHHTDEHGIPIYTSDSVSSCWCEFIPDKDNFGKYITESRGFISVGSITYRSALYCAKYMQKIAHEDMKIPPYICMSNRPGIGAEFVSSELLQDSKIYYDGHTYNLPRYFIKRLENLGYDTFWLKNERAFLASRYSPIRSSESIQAMRDKEKKLKTSFKSIDIPFDY